MKTLTLKDFKKIKPHAIFAFGYARDSDDVQMRWIAVKACNRGVDWAIYTGLPEESDDHIKRWGRKISNKTRIREMVNCTDDFFALYRY